MLRVSRFSAPRGLNAISPAEPFGTRHVRQAAENSARADAGRLAIVSQPERLRAGRTRGRCTRARRPRPAPSSSGGRLRRRSAVPAWAGSAKVEPDKPALASRSMFDLLSTWTAVGTPSAPSPHRPPNPSMAATRRRGLPQAGAAAGRCRRTQRTPAPAASSR